MCLLYRRIYISVGTEAVLTAWPKRGELDTNFKVVAICGRSVKCLGYNSRELLHGIMATEAQVDLVLFLFCIKIIKISIFEISL